MRKKYPIRDDIILVALDSRYVYIRKDVFTLLFENTHIYYKKDYLRSLTDNKIKFSKLQELSREAGIPYSLFFAPIDRVEENIQKNNDILFAGVQNVPIAIASRGDIMVRDVNLIIKDIQKRQQFMARYNAGTPMNAFMTLRPSEVVDTAALIVQTLEIDMDKFRSYSKKESAYDFLVSALEKKNIIVSRSRPGVMPQTIKPGLAFSGFAVRHKKYPAIFLHSKDDDSTDDPAGRRIFTIFLLLACITNKKFATVSYNQNVKEPAQNIEYLIAEEILMPEAAVSGIRVDTLAELDVVAKAFQVTPSMAAVRLKRLKCLDSSTFDILFDDLNKKWLEAPLSKEKGKFVYNVKDITKVITYNGRLFTECVVGLLRSNKLNEGDAARLLLFKKRSKSLVKEIADKI